MDPAAFWRPRSVTQSPASQDVDINIKNLFPQQVLRGKPFAFEKNDLVIDVPIDERILQMSHHEWSTYKKELLFASYGGDNFTFYSDKQSGKPQPRNNIRVAFVYASAECHLAPHAFEQYQLSRRRLSSLQENASIRNLLAGGGASNSEPTSLGTSRRRSLLSIDVTTSPVRFPPPSPAGTTQSQQLVAFPQSSSSDSDATSAMSPSQAATATGILERKQSQLEPSQHQDREVSVLSASTTYSSQPITNSSGSKPGKMLTFPGYPIYPKDQLPANITLRQMCRCFPNHLLHRNLRPFIQASWDYTEINALVPFKDRKTSDHAGARSFMWNRLEREKSVLKKEGQLDMLMKAPRLMEDGKEEDDDAFEANLPSSHPQVQKRLRSTQAQSNAADDESTEDDSAEDDSAEDDSAEDNSAEDDSAEDPESDSSEGED